MNNLLEWNHNQVDSDKNRSEYEMDEEGSLDNLLYRMYMEIPGLESQDISRIVKILGEDLLSNYRKRIKKYEIESRKNIKANEALQKRYDKLLQENKELKEVNDSLQEEMDRRFGWLDDSPSEEEMAEERERHEREQREFEEYDADREPSVVRHLLGYCIGYVSNIENVPDAHVECIKDMLESLMDESSDVNKMSESDRLVLTKQLHSIKKKRKQMKLKRDHEKKAEEKATVNNNYYGSIGIKSDRTDAIYSK